MDKRRDDRMLVEAIGSLAKEVCAFRCQLQEFCAQVAAQLDNQAILKRIETKVDQVMGKVNDFLVAQKAYNEGNKTAIGGIATTITEVAGDQDELLKKIEALQNTPGDFTPEEKVLADQIQADSKTIATTLASAAEALNAVNSKVPPAVPVVPMNQ